MATNPNQNLRTPPSAGGRRRVTPGYQQPQLNAETGMEGRRTAARPQPPKKSLLKSTAGYWIPPLVTGGGFAGFGVLDYFV